MNGTFLNGFCTIGVENCPELCRNKFESSEVTSSKVAKFDSFNVAASKKSPVLIYRFIGKV